MKTIENSLNFGASDTAAFRLKVLEHGKKHGVGSACDAFEVSRASYFRWQKKFLDSGKKVIALVPMKTRPKRARCMTTDYRLVGFIKQMRVQFGNIGGGKIKIFLDQYADELGINSIGVRTIDKIIKRRNLYFNKKKRAKFKKIARRVRVKRSPKVSSPGLVQMDSVAFNILNRRFHFICCMDIYTRLAHVKYVGRLNSLNALKTLQEFTEKLPFSVHTIQTDNGSEFLLHFDQYLQNHHIEHVFTYPRSPRVNGYIKRFNRTLQNECLDMADSLIYDSVKFETKLTKWLDWYNAKRPHFALGCISPQQFLQSHSLKR